MGSRGLPASPREHVASPSGQLCGAPGGRTTIPILTVPPEETATGWAGGPDFMETPVVSGNRPLPLPSNEDERPQPWLQHRLRGDPPHSLSLRVPICQSDSASSGQPADR